MAVVISFNASNRFEKEFWDCVSKVLIPLPQDIQEEITGNRIGDYSLNPFTKESSNRVIMFVKKGK